jgi:sulfur carrier protein ThiS
MMIRIVGKNSVKRDLEKSTPISMVVSDLGLNVNSYVILLNGNPATTDEIAAPQDDLVFLEVFSGG